MWKQGCWVILPEDLQGFLCLAKSNVSCCVEMAADLLGAVMANRLCASSFVGTTRSHPAISKGRKSTDDSSLSLI